MIKKKLKLNRTEKKTVIITGAIEHNLPVDYIEKLKNVRLIL